MAKGFKTVGYNTQYSNCKCLKKCKILSFYGNNNCGALSKSVWAHGLAAYEEIVIDYGEIVVVCGEIVIDYGEIVVVYGENVVVYG